MTLWTPSHVKTVIPEFIVFAILAVCLWLLLRNKSETVKRIPLMVIAVTLVVMEIFKQIASFEEGVYDTYSLPFHYCSLFLYVLPVHAFYRGKHKGAVTAIAVSLSAALLLFMLIMPDIVYGEYRITEYFDDYLNFHTVTFHGLVCLYFMISVALGLARTNLGSDVKVIPIFLVVYELIAFPLAQILQTNFHNLYVCNVQFLEDIRVAAIESLGTFIGKGLHLLTNLAMTVTFTLVAYFILYFAEKAYEKIKK